MPDSHNERRKDLRIYRNFIVSYHEKGKSSASRHVSQVNNVSKGGLSFSSTQALKKGVVVTIDLKTPFIADSVSLDGIVLECKDKIPEMIYEIRLQFQEVPEKVLAILEKIENCGKA